MKRVAAGVIRNDGKILVARRSNTRAHPGKWEFPGGKIEVGESPEDCLTRELTEELGMRAQIQKLLCSSAYDYPNESVEVLAFICDALSLPTKMVSHSEIVWVGPIEVLKLDLLAADIPIAKQYLETYDNS